MKKLFIFLAIMIVLAVGFFSFIGKNYNLVQTLDEQVNADWSEVLNQYKRRADLVPNLVASVKGYATHESKVFIDVAQARAKVASLNISSDKAPNTQQLAEFQKTQSQMSSALSRLLVVSERYPELKANSLFQDLNTQLEGTENRITVARGRYIKAVQNYNTIIRTFPTNIMASIFNYERKANFTVENEKAIQEPPKVDFSTPIPAPAQ